MKTTVENPHAMTCGVNMKDTKHPVYRAGAQAYRLGLDENECPFPLSDFGGFMPDRIRWFNGYVDARLEARLKHRETL